MTSLDSIKKKPERKIVLSSETSEKVHCNVERTTLSGRSLIFYKLLVLQENVKEKPS